MKRFGTIKKFAFRTAALIIIAMGAVSCSEYIEKKVAFESIEKVSYVGGADFQFDLRVRNDLPIPMAIKSGHVTLKFRQQNLATLNLKKPVGVEPTGVQTVETTWRLTGDIGAVMTSLGRHVLVKHGSDELYVDYEIKVAAKGMTRTLEDHNIPVDSFAFNFQNLF